MSSHPTHPVPVGPAVTPAPPEGTSPAAPSPAAPSPDLRPGRDDHGRRHRDRVPVLGVGVDRLDRRAARAEVLRLSERPGHDTLSFVNAHALNLASRDASYRQTLQRSSLVLNDGIGVAIAGRLEGAGFVDNLNGSDFLPLVLADLAARRDRVFFYGAAPGVAERAAARWSALLPGLDVVGTLDGYTLSRAAAAEVVRGARPDVVLVALGNPRQEIWARHYGPRTGARLTIGVGAFFDFSTGVVRRAPRPVRALRLEWAFRLLQEPRRLARRYLVGNPAFLARVALARVLPSRFGPAWARPAAPTAPHPAAGRSRAFTADDGVVVHGPWHPSDDVERVV